MRIIPWFTMVGGQSPRKRNYIALLIRRTVVGFFNNVPSQYVNVYVVEAGFSEQDLGNLRSLGMILAAPLSAALNFMADVANRRRAYLAGLLLEMLSAVFFFINGGFAAILAAIMLASVSFFGLSMIENILIADSARGGQRVFGFSVINFLAVIASLLAPIAAAHMVNLFGGISASGIRPLFLVQFLGLAAVSIVPLLYVRDVRPVVQVSAHKAVRDAVEILRLNPWLKRWILIEILGGYVFPLSMPFETIYAVKVKGADEFVLGYMGFMWNLGSLVATPLFGKLADRIGRVKAILLLRPLYYLGVILLITAPDPRQLILAWLIRGVWSASFAPFQTLAIELVPYDYRGRWSGIRALISFPLRSPGSLIGGFLYTHFRPETPFIVAVLVDLVLRVPLIYTTPETLDRRRYLENFRRV